MANRVPAIDPATASVEVQEQFKAIKSKFGMVPNLLKVMANSPATLNSYLAMSNSLGQGVLSAKTRERIALAVSQFNACEYCLSAHSLTAKLAGLPPDQIVEARHGKANDPKSQAALNLTSNILERRGNVSSDQIDQARQAGLTDAEIVEVVGNVTIMVLTNYLNNVAQTEIDFPKVALNA